MCAIGHYSLMFVDVLLALIKAQYNCSLTVGEIANM